MLINGTRQLYESKDLNNFFNASWGYYVPLYSPNPNVGFGFNAFLYGGFRIYSTGNNAILADVGLPVTASFRLGAGSTRDAYFPVGVGFGAGYKLNTWIVDRNPFERHDATFVTFCRPYIFTELVFDYQKRNNSFFDNFKIQLAIQPKCSKTVYDSESRENINYKMSYYNLSFIKFLSID